MKTTDVKLWTAMITPFTSAGAVDYDVMKKLIHRQLEGGVKGLLLFGSTGETPTLTADEEEKIAIVARDNKKDALIMMGVTHNVTSRAVENAKKAKDLGADALLLAPPYYNKPMPEGVRAHFEAVHAATDLPLVIYNIPGRVGVNMSFDLIKDLALLPNIVGVKEASADLLLASRLISDTDLAVWSGDDALILPYMSVGGVGGTSVNSNLFPALYQNMIDAYAAGHCAEAVEITTKLANWYPLVFSETNPIGIKAAMALAELIENELRMPLLPMSDQNTALLKDMLSQISPSCSTQSE